MKNEFQVREYLGVLIEEYQKLESQMEVSIVIKEISAMGNKMGVVAIKIGTLLWVLGEEADAIAEYSDEWTSLVKDKNRRRLAQIGPGADSPAT